MKFFVRFLRKESGATALEYGLIAGLVAIAAIGAMDAMGDSLQATFAAVHQNFSN